MSFGLNWNSFFMHDDTRFRLPMAILFVLNGVNMCVYFLYLSFDTVALSMNEGQTRTRIFGFEATNEVFSSGNPR